MSAAGKVALAAAAGYVLGRRRKFKLAITVGSMLAGQRIATNPRGLLRQGSELVESNPELAKISDQVRSQLLTAVRAAAVATVSKQMEDLGSAMRGRSEKLLTIGSQGDEETEGEAEEASADQGGSENVDEAEVDSDEEPRESDEEDQERPEASDASERPRRSSSGTAKKSTPRSSTRKSSPPSKTSKKASSTRKKSSTSSSAGRSK